MTTPLRRVSLVLGLALATAVLSPARSRADTVVLKNGRTLSGKVVAAGPEAVILEVPAGSGHGTIKIPRSQVVEVRDGDLDPGAPPAGIAAPSPSPKGGGGLDGRATGDLEARLRELGPSREERLESLEPSPADADALVALEHGLDDGTLEAARRLAARGRPALLVAARALASDSRPRRTAAALAIADLAKEPGARPYVLALDLPRLLMAAAGDEATDGSPRARHAARRALAAIARREPSRDDRIAPTRALEDAERLALGLMKDGWDAERREQLLADEPRLRERAEIDSELARRGVVAPGERAAATPSPAGASPAGPPASEASLPEPALLLPRLVLAPPGSLAVRGDGAGRALGFAADLENRGQGPLELRVSDTGRLDPCAVQRVLARYPGSERCVTERERTLGRLVPDAGHGHRHLDRVLRFELLDPSFGPLPGLRAGESAGCLRDVRRVSGGGPLEPRFTGAGELSGLSAGWSAPVGPGDAGLALGSLEDGDYWLVVSVGLGFDGASEPDDLAAAVRLRLSGREVSSLETLDGRALRARRALRRAEIH